MGKYEDDMLEKEIDIVDLKYNLHELKQRFEEKEEEIDLLKVNNMTIEEQLKEINAKNQEFKKQFERDLEKSALKNQLLEKKLDCTENQLLTLKKRLEDEEVEKRAIKCEVEDVKNTLTETVKEIQFPVNNDVRKLKEEVVNSKRELKSTRNHIDKLFTKNNIEINKLSARVAKSEKEIKNNFNILNEVEDVNCKEVCQEENDAEVNAHDENIHKVMLRMESKLSQEINDAVNRLSDQVTNFEKGRKIDFNTLNDKIVNEIEDINEMKDWKKVVDKAIINIDDLEYHLINLENTLFCDLSHDSKDIILQWTLQNYHCHSDLGEIVYSPKFYTQMKGYCFQLYVKWSGTKKENLGLYLKIHSGGEVVEPFRIQYSLEVISNKGSIFSRKVSAEDIEANVEAFALPSGVKQSTKGCGYDKFLIMPKLSNYIVNDMLSVRCRLTPS